MTFGKTMIKALKTFDIDPKPWPALPIVTIGAIGSTNDTSLLRRVNT